MIGIVIGIGSVISMISLGEVAKATARAEYEALGTDILIIKIHGRIPVSLADTLALMGGVPSIREAAPRISSQGKFRHAGKSLGDGSIQGVTASFAHVNKLGVNEGRFISDFDITRHWCVIGAGIAEAMRRTGTQQIIGETVEMDGWLFTVVGILDEEPENYSLPFQVNANVSIFVPITTMPRIRSTLSIDSIVVRVQADTHPETTARDVRAWFQKRNPNL